MSIRKAVPSLLAAVLLAGCGTVVSSRDAAVAAIDPATNGRVMEPTLRLERVVMLMRHGVRSPTKVQVTAPGTHDRPWPAWPVGEGELTDHGSAAAALVGAWDRANWSARGLFAGAGCPAAGTVRIDASAKSRTQATARAFADGFAPGCSIPVAFPAHKNDDVAFHPIDVGAMPFDADAALRAVQALLPPGGLQAEINDRRGAFALLDMALGCCSAPVCAAGAPAGDCSLAKMPVGLVRNDDDRPDIGDPFGIASTASQTFLLEYLEGMPMADVAWGRLDRTQIETLLQFHALKFNYEARAPYVAARAASPLATLMLDALDHGPALTVLVGHDTNIADVGGFFDLHWQVPSYPRDDQPPGGAIGFELLADAAGERYVRAFYRSQTMDQVRALQPLDAANPASYVYLDIPGCAANCPLADFERATRAKLIAPLAAKTALATH